MGTPPTSLASAGSGASLEHRFEADRIRDRILLAIGYVTNA